MISPERLRVIVITDARQAGARGVESVVAAALRGGARAVQLREKVAGAGEVLGLARRLRVMTRDAGALFFVNDRLDLALATDADGVHLGPRDLPVALVRAAAPEGFLIGYSTDDPVRARQAVADGADYIGCGTVWATSSKEDAGRTIGISGLARVAASVPVPVIAIGGITPTRTAELRGSGATGVAVVGAVMSSPSPDVAVAQLLRALSDSPSGTGG